MIIAEAAEVRDEVLRELIGIDRVRQSLRCTAAAILTGLRSRRASSGKRWRMAMPTAVGMSTSANTAKNLSNCKGMKRPSLRNHVSENANIRGMAKIDSTALIAAA